MNIAIRIITKRNYDQICSDLGISGKEATLWMHDEFGYGTKKYPMIDLFSARRKIFAARKDPNYPFNTLAHPDLPANFQVTRVVEAEA
jgi:hypothetical protein